MQTPLSVKEVEVWQYLVEHEVFVRDMLRTSLANLKTRRYLFLDMLPEFNKVYKELLVRELRNSMTMLFNLDPEQSMILITFGRIKKAYKLDRNGYDI